MERLSRPPSHEVNAMEIILGINGLHSRIAHNYRAYVEDQLLSQSRRIRQGISSLSTVSTSCSIRTHLPAPAERQSGVTADDIEIGVEAILALPPLPAVTRSFYTGGIPAKIVDPYQDHISPSEIIALEIIDLNDRLLREVTTSHKFCTVINLRSKFLGSLYKTAFVKSDLVLEAWFTSKPSSYQVVDEIHQLQSREKILSGDLLRPRKGSINQSDVRACQIMAMLLKYIDDADPHAQCVALVGSGKPVKLRNSGPITVKMRTAESPRLDPATDQSQDELIQHQSILNYLGIRVNPSSTIVEEKILPVSGNLYDMAILSDHAILVSEQVTSILSQ